MSIAGGTRGPAHVLLEKGLNALSLRFTGWRVELRSDMVVVVQQVCSRLAMDECQQHPNVEMLQIEAEK